MMKHPIPDPDALSGKYLPNAIKVCEHCWLSLDFLRQIQVTNPMGPVVCMELLRFQFEGEPEKAEYRQIGMAPDIVTAVAWLQEQVAVRGTRQWAIAQDPEAPGGTTAVRAR